MTYQPPTTAQLRQRLTELQRAAGVNRAQQEAILRRLGDEGPAVDHELDAQLTRALLLLEADRLADMRRASPPPEFPDTPALTAMRRHQLLAALDVWSARHAA